MNEIEGNNLIDDEIKTYFSEGEYDKLSDTVKRRHRTVYKNYLEMKEWGLDPLIPDFIQNFNDEKNKKKTNTEKKKKDKIKKDTIKTTITRTKRNVSVKNYLEEEVPELDSFVYCDKCKKEFKDFCPQCGTLTHLYDTPVKLGVADRAKLTLPKGYLVIRESPIHGLGVFAKKILPAGTRMGPYEGLLSRRQNDIGFSWLLQNGKTVDAKDPTKSNWMRFVNCARHHNEQNTVAFQYKGQMYYRTVKDLNVGDEMLVYYGDEFANNLGIDTEQYFKPAEENIIEGTFSCFYCPYAFLYKSMRDKHELRCQNKHTTLDKIEIFKCLKCNIAVSSKELLQIHEKTCGKFKTKKNVDESEKKYRCSDCNFSSKYKYSLQQHYNNMHLKLKEYQCHICPYKTSQKSHFTTHSYIHNKIKPFVCYQCKKGFNRKLYLKVHFLKYHSNNNQESLFNCNECNYKTYDKWNLKKHILNKHSNNPHKKYCCKNCKYKTNYLCNFKSHSYTHFDIKPYKCIKCDYTTCLITNLKTHINKKHIN